MTTYLGFDVLALQPNAREAWESLRGSSLVVTDSGYGKRDVRAKADSPVESVGYLLSCLGRPAVAELLGWFNAKRGRAIPFWVSTQRRDLVLTAPAGASDSSLQVARTGYPTRQWPYPSRRFLALQRGSAALVPVRVTSAAEGASFDTLTLSGAIGVDVPEDTRVSLLLLCRFDSDELAVQYISDSVSEAKAQLVEVPGEVP